MKIILPVVLLLLTGFAVYASGKYDSQIYTKNSNIALSGYDTVSFFTGSEPVVGNQVWKTEYKDAVWLFSSESNLNLFIEDPDKYAPAYGGYCAWAMSYGKLAPGKPKYWDIIDGRLYLNYSSSTRRKFLADIESMITNADKKWPEIKGNLTGKKN